MARSDRISRANPMNLKELASLALFLVAFSALLFAAQP